MVRPPKIEDYPQIKRLYAECFGTSESYLDFFLRKCFSKWVIVNETDNKITSSAFILQLSYVSTDKCGIRHFHPGLYLHGLCTSGPYRRKGFASMIIDSIKVNMRQLGWQFIIVRPDTQELIPMYEKEGFTVRLYRKNNLPQFENACNITQFDSTNLFLTRDKTLGTDYFQWSKTSLDFIIKDSLLHPSNALNQAFNNIEPYILLCPLSPSFKTESSYSTFSYTLE